MISRPKKPAPKPKEPADSEDSLSERLQQLVERFADPVAVLSVKKGIILAHNKAFRELAGYQNEDIMGMQIHQLLAPESHPLLDKLLEKGEREEGRHRVTCSSVRLKRRTGTTRHIDLVAWPRWEEEALAGMMVAFPEERDGSEAKLLAFFSHSIAHAGEGHIILDIQGRIVYVNPVYADMLGYTPSQLVGQPVAAFVDLSGLESASFQEALMNQGCWEGEIRYKTKDGQVFPVKVTAVLVRDTSGEALGIVSSVVDVSWQRREAMARIQAEALSKAYLEVAESLVVILNREGSILLVNRAAEEVLDRPREELLGRNWFSICVPSYAKVEAEAAFQRVLAGEKVESVEIPVATKGGKERLVRWQYAVLTDHEGRVTGVLCSGKDVTAQRKAEEELRRKVRELQGLYQVSKAVSECEDIPQLLRRVAQVVSGSMHHADACCAIRLRGVERVVGEVLVVEGNMTSEGRKCFDRLVSGLTVTPLEEAQVVVKKHRPILMAPIRVDEQPVGWLAVGYEDEKENFLPGELIFLREVGQMLGLALEAAIARHRLVSSESRYRNLFEHADALIFLIDPQLTTITANKAARAFIAKIAEPTSIPPKELSKYIHPDDRGELQQVIKQVRRGEPAKFCFRVAMASGEYRHLEGVVSPIRGPGGQVQAIHVIAQDVTQRKQQEEAREQQRRDLEAINAISRAVEGLVDPLRILDDSLPIILKATGFDGGAFYLSKGKVLRLAAHQFSERVDTAEFFPPELPLSWASQMKEATMAAPPGISSDLSEEGYRWVSIPLRSGDNLVGVLVLAGKMEGKSLPTNRLSFIEALASPVAAAVNNALLLQQLQLSEQRAYGLINGLEQGVLVEDNHGRIVFANAKALSLLGYEMDELLGKHWSSLVPKEWRSVVERESAKRPVGVATQYEAALLTKDGRQFPVLIAASPLMTSSGFSGVLTVFADITDRKRIEAQILEDKREAEFYTDLVTHDLNNVNQVLMTYLEVLMEGLEEEDPRRKMLKDAMEQVRRSVSLTSKIRKLFRIRASEKPLEPIDLREILERARKATITQWPGRSITIEFRLPKGPIMVLADSLAEELFANLFDNAVKFNPNKKVKVRVSVGKQRIKGTSYWRIRVTDYGKGIPDDQKQILFQRFRRGKTKVKGSGLGLSIVKTLVDRYRGIIEVANRVPEDHSKGTVFTVWLPAATNKPDEDGKTYQSQERKA